MSEREKLLRRLRAYKFAQWELHIFLDTHPNNKEAAARMKEYSGKITALQKQYEDMYGPIDETSDNTSRWAWITGPWPWEALGGDES